MSPLRWIGLVVAIAIIGAIIFFQGIIRFYTDWLWFNNVGYTVTFWVSILSRVWVGLAVGAAFFLVLFLNLLVARRAISRMETLTGLYQFPDFLTSGRITLLFFLFSLVAGSLAGLAGTQYWLVVQQFLRGTSFGYGDPLFGIDVGFYVFKLPFYRYVYGLVMGLLVLTIIVLGLIYLFTRSLSFQGLKIEATPLARYHLSILVALAFIVKAWGYRLGIYNLVYSARGVVFGASYTDVHAQLFALRILSVIAIVSAILVFADVILRGQRFTVAGILTLIIGSFVLGGVYPGLVQRLVVEPNEIAKERPYIEHNIKFTRIGYALDRIQEKDFDVRDALTYGDLAKNADTISNIRLWDWRPLKQTYSQLQEIRLYYDFDQVDVDRYVINGKLTEVMLSAREIAVDQIPPQAKTWINEHLKYTHGYGLCMSPVNRVTGEGLPDFFIKDIPPRSTADLPITRPEIYYGEMTDRYVIVKARTPEFDYPSGDQNAYATYEGTGGVPLSSFGRKLAFALRFGSLKILLSSDISLSSRAMFYRNIRDRVKTIAPFLVYDQDPYLVLSEGRLFWIWDAYTLTNMFPYSQPYEGINYIRNSVKVVIDAYNGDVRFYVFDPEDPIINTYAKIFRGMFKDADSMPAGLREHIRYPEDMFTLQARVFNTYHMREPVVFYNKEDVWDIPTEIYAGNEQAIQPYYTIMRLPGEARAEFILMLPLTPAKKNNMVAWLAARSGGEDYGKLLVYKFPKQRLVYGPMQIEARIDQDPEISKLLTLWSQKGSRVIRGNLLVIPIDSSLLYVEPLYLLAEQSELPELKRVTVVYGSKVVMDETLEAALARTFGTAPPRETPAPAETKTALDAGGLARQALDIYRDMQDKLRAGDWAGFGRRLRDLGDALGSLLKKTQ